MIVEGPPKNAELRPNYHRRALGSFICLSPAVLLFASLGVGWGFPRQSGIGMGLIALGLLVAGVNLTLSFLRPSGLPVVGTLLVVLGGLAGFADWRVATAGLVALVLDTGGLPWFLLATWRDRSFWDADSPTAAIQPRPSESSPATAVAVRPASRPQTASRINSPIAVAT